MISEKRKSIKEGDDILTLNSMKNIHTIIVSILLWTAVPLSIKAQEDLIMDSEVNLQNMLTPFWESDTIYNETVQPIRRQGQLPEGSLLFRAHKILSVKDTYLDKHYKKNKDWKYKNGKVILPQGSRIPYFTQEDLIFEDKRDKNSFASKVPGKFVLWSEQGLLQSKQLAITYIKSNESQWRGIIPNVAKDHLPTTLSRLKNGRPVKIVFYGNSIETGVNSSSTLNQSPYLPTWPELIIYNLRKQYKGRIEFSNRSKGGMKADWGVENAKKLVNPENPDLVIIGFGMNDGSAKINPDTFVNQIKSIVDTIKSSQSKCEFIVITTMLANPDVVLNGYQKLYRKPILELEENGIAIADMTAVHEELLHYKSYQDMTGNNVNHPNDYLARWYAQIINALLIP